jgi:hypothetical protein
MSLSISVAGKWCRGARITFFFNPAIWLSDVKDLRRFLANVFLAVLLPTTLRFLPHNPFFPEPPCTPLQELWDFRDRRGFGSVCITDTGAMGGRLLGIVTSRDYDFVTDPHTPLTEIMTVDVQTATDDGGGGSGGGGGGGSCVDWRWRYRFCGRGGFGSQPRFELACKRDPHCSSMEGGREGGRGGGMGGRMDVAALSHVPTCACTPPSPDLTHTCPPPTHTHPPFYLPPQAPSGRRPSSPTSRPTSTASSP